jgi:(p)ppGpp synthase/HD superfamily hydrolase
MLTIHSHNGKIYKTLGGIMSEKAKLFATQKHSGQYRKVSGEPYVNHVLHVGELVSTFKISKKLPQLVEAGILHDTLEDTDTTFVELASEFSPLVASLVLELTSDPKLVQQLSKKEYLKRKMLGMSSYGLFIKLCDRLSNVMDHPTDKAIISTREIIEFLRENRKLSQSHLSVIHEIEKYIGV